LFFNQLLIHQKKCRFSAFGNIFLNIFLSRTQVISKSIEELSVDPRPAGCKKLKGNNGNLWRMRVGNYRIIYIVDDIVRIVNVRKIGHRKDVYD